MKNILIIISTLTLLVSCVERKITILSDPPNAIVWIDGKEKGKTPVTVPFTFYGTREITLYLDGYRKFTKMQPIKIPYYQYFPADFISEFLLPYTIKDRHQFFYYLEPYYPLSKNEKEKIKKSAKYWHKKFHSEDAKKNN